MMENVITGNSAKWAQREPKIHLFLWVLMQTMALESLVSRYFESKRPLPI